MTRLRQKIAYRLLCRVSPPNAMKTKHWAPVAATDTWAMLSMLFGQEIREAAHDKVVIDFGCGTGADAIELAKAGARHVIGLDRDEGALEHARQRAAAAGVGDRCEFLTRTDVVADLVISCDTFEHVESLERALIDIRRMLSPTGALMASFGPPWHHPKGGHIFSVFPWSHLIFSEAVLTRWRSAFKAGAPVTSFRECGLNRMTVERFSAVVERSPFRLDHLELVPVRLLRHLGLQHFRLTREFVTAAVKCWLVPKTHAGIAGSP